jgi:hypothetical protein
MADLNKTDKMYLERLATGPVQFIHGIDIHGRATKLLRSSVSPSLQKHYHRLAVSGYVSEVVSGDNGQGNPPEHVVTYSLTALGRSKINLRNEPKPPVNRWTPPSNYELAQEGSES